MVWIRLVIALSFLGLAACVMSRGELNRLETRIRQPDPSRYLDGGVANASRFGERGKIASKDVHRLNERDEVDTRHALVVSRSTIRRASARWASCSGHRECLPDRSLLLVQRGEPCASRSCTGPFTLGTHRAA